jgi:uncharacterized surface protein with fasciclin (FAS1) repeats
VRYLTDGGEMATETTTATTATSTAATTTTAAEPALEPVTLLDVARVGGRFDTLLAVIDADGLGDVLTGGDLTTLFSPTDDAFAELPRGRSTLSRQIRRRP